ncbi:hypothetical protein LSCM1_07020 [Leishmania martiniquensis]|uniref:PDZ domain-containing protein n=1 Tax=Leishmania martiniquensis TaxID=1580590 RepID=A0A836HY17_9TRYP|nr:hypothetical protein LSCM1_07020 [Leishmania martiniquensis]
MCSHLTEHVLFTALREYASRLEVQYMIEEEVKKFQEKVLPRLLSEALATASHAAAAEPTAGGLTAGAVTRRASSPSPSPSASAAPSHTSTTLNSEWVQTFVRAHADDVIGRQLPLLISQEVQRQLRSVNERAQAASNEAAPSPSPGSPPRGEAAGARARPDLPTLPLSPPRLPLAPPRERTAGLAEMCPGNLRSGETREITLAASTIHDEGRRQREQILNAIADIEHQLKATQRDLNGVVQQQQLSRRRLEYLFESLQGVGLSPTSESEPLSLCAALEQALDDRQADAVRARLATVLQGLLRHWTEARLGRGVGAHDQDASTLGSSPLPAPQADRLPYAPLASAKSYVMPRCSHYTPPQRLDHSPSRLHGDSPSPVRIAADAAGAPPAQPQHMPGRAPADLALMSERSLACALYGDAGASPSRAKRSSKTRGTVASLAVAQAAPSPALPSAPEPPAFRTASATSPSSSPSAAQHSRAQPDADETASRLASPPQEYIDSSLRERAGRGTHASSSMRMADVCVATSTAAVSPASCTYRSNARPRSVAHHDVPSSSIMAASPSRGSASSRMASRAVVLGIEAVNVPSGALPGALSSHGAVRVQSVAPLQLAERAGMCGGDVLLSVDHHPVGSCEELRDVLAAVPATQLSIAVELYRQTIHQVISMKLQL